MMDEVYEEVVVRSAPDEDARTKIKRQPPYAVVLHNDSVNGFAYVVGVLQRVFGYGKPKAYRLTLAAHFLGRSTVWIGALEVAEFKAEQIKACGPDPDQKKEKTHPLMVSLEPLPGT